MSGWPPEPPRAGLGVPVQAPLRGRTAGGGLRTGWLLPLLVFAAWFSLPPWCEVWWKSDDFLALDWVQSLPRALGDLSGNQYGAQGIVAFYRPLVTLSLWLDAALAGADPLLAHLHNALAHALAALLVARIAVRFVSGRAAWLTALLWGTAPGHASAVLWAVGRVDTHSTLFVLLACLCACRFVEGRSRSRGPMVIAFVLALLCKESALVAAGAAPLLAFGLGNGDRFVGDARGGGLRARAASSWRVLWPLWIVASLYLGWRTALFGSPLGGYDAGSFDLQSSARDLARFLLWTANPLLLSDATLLSVPEPLRWLGLLPLGLATAMLLARRRFLTMLALLVLLLGALVPTFQLWTPSDNVQKLRYLYLAAIPLAAWTCAGGVLPALLALLVAALPLVEIRRAYHASSQHARAMHASLIATAPDFAGQPLFVAGLPRSAAGGRVVAFHLGVDRLLLPPFVPAERAHAALYALRPLAGGPPAWQLEYDDERGLPVEDAVTLRFDGPAILGRLPAARLAPLSVTVEGVHRFVPEHLRMLHEGRAESWLVMRGVRAPFFRVTVFTAGGYLTAVVPDQAAAGSPDGRVAVLAVLEARYVTTLPGPDMAHVAFGLTVPATFDRSTRFPVLVEAGVVEQTAAGPVFAATHAARELLTFELGRDHAAFMGGR